ncbi:ABC transporter ATP-binding protein [Nibricoccus aquaticus]|uniref:ABC transporter ATP-binding protein n=1 Tax=Nibricoccus aquaticus TaxID=2576891 RepID=UPI001586C863|nr:ABC transporter ATP-binding protein [Nibricoccus aquaticus]
MTFSSPDVVSAAPPPLPTERNARDYVIQADGLTKVYGAQRALDGVTLHVPPGTIGLLGPNGAGKSTFIKCLLNLETPTSGRALVLGRDIRASNRESRERVGYSPEQDSHIPGVVGCEYVTYCGQLSGLSFKQARQRAHEILDLVGMGQERYRKIDTYSTGMKQRAKLAQALVHDPEILFLDEPTNGLDPAGREYFLRLIGSLHKQLGTSVVISSHLLNDIERICDRVIIIARGRVLEHDSMENLKNRHRRIVEFAPSGESDRVAAALKAGAYKFERLSNGRFRIESPSDSVEWLLELLRVHRLPPGEIVANPNALHELFLRSLASADGNHA